MAAELELIYPVAASNLYAVVRRHSDAKVRDVVAAAWDTWADGDIADYDIALTDKSGDLYQGDWPTGVVAGRYRVTYYLRAGATAAITDTIIASGDFNWDGAGLSSGSSVTLSVYALCTLDQAKRQLRITTTAWDTHITELINAVTDQAERITGRQFVARDHRAFLTTSVRRWTVPHWPVLALYGAWTGNNVVLDATYTPGTADRATVTVMESEVRLYTFDSSSGQTTTSLTFADNLTVDAMATAIAAETGWAATSYNDNVPCEDLLPGTRSAWSTTAKLEAPTEPDDGVILDRPRGLLTFTTATRPESGSILRSHPAHNRVVKYRAGFDTVPDDLVHIACELTADAFRGASLNGNLASESLGDWSYSLADPAALASRAWDKLRRYSTIRVGGAA